MQAGTGPLPFGQGKLESGNIEVAAEEEVLVQDRGIRGQRTRIAASLVLTALWVHKHQRLHRVIGDSSNTTLSQSTSLFALSEYVTYVNPVVPLPSTKVDIGSV